MLLHLASALCFEGSKKAQQTIDCAKRRPERRDKSARCTYLSLPTATHPDKYHLTTPPRVRARVTNKGNQSRGTSSVSKKKVFLVTVKDDVGGSSKRPTIASPLALPLPLVCQRIDRKGEKKNPPFDGFPETSVAPDPRPHLLYRYPTNGAPPRGQQGTHVKRRGETGQGRQAGSKADGRTQKRGRAAHTIAV